MTSSRKGFLVSDLVQPHGGVLVDRVVAADRADALRDRARSLPGVTLDGREVADLELIAIGAASPLTGFLGARDYRAVVEDLRLADGTVWPLPFTLALDESIPAGPGDDLALHDAHGHLWGLLHVTDVFERDPREEARIRVWGTCSGGLVGSPADLSKSCR
jgi:sulfate adenylyltransferase